MWRRFRHRGQKSQLKVSVFPGAGHLPSSALCRSAGWEPGPAAGVGPGPGTGDREWAAEINRRGGGSGGGRIGSAVATGRPTSPPRSKSDSTACLQLRFGCATVRTRTSWMSVYPESPYRTTYAHTGPACANILRASGVRREWVAPHTRGRPPKQTGGRWSLQCKLTIA